MRCRVCGNSRLVGRRGWTILRFGICIAFGSLVGCEERFLSMIWGSSNILGENVLRFQGRCCEKT